MKAVEHAREINKRMSGIIAEEWLPGPDFPDRESLKRYVHDQAWGHHASCTAKMGAENDPLAVVDSKFRVIGTRNLRVVDASVFPRIPGFFIVTPIYMIAEKASEAILADAAESASVPMAGKN
ncbi:MAG TPA: GMC family oxidoreductase [Xanthobacteraceae bacterium]